MAVICIVTETFSVKYWRELEIWVRGRSRSFKMPPIDRSYDLLIICLCNYSVWWWWYRVASSSS